MRDTLDPFHHKGLEGNPFVRFVSKILSPENIWAFVLFLIVVALIIFTSDSSPAWIYQGF
jgi:hypothetical protein